MLLSKRLGTIFESIPTGRMSICFFKKKMVPPTFFLSQCYFSNAFTSQIPVGTSCKVCHWMSSLSCICPSRIPVTFSRTQSNASEFYLANTAFGVSYRFCGTKKLNKWKKCHHCWLLDVFFVRGHSQTYSQASFLSAYSFNIGQVIMVIFVPDLLLQFLSFHSSFFKCLGHRTPDGQNEGSGPC